MEFSLNNKYSDDRGKSVSVVSSPPPVHEWGIETYADDFNLVILLTGPSEVVNVDWDDGTNENLTGAGYIHRVHHYSNVPAIDHHITFSNGQAISDLLCDFDHIVAVHGLDTCVNLVNLSMAGNQISTFASSANWSKIEAITLSGSSGILVFDTFPEWVKLNNLSLQQCGLTSIDLRPEWVDMKYLTIPFNEIPVITVPYEWSKILQLDLGVNTMITGLSVQPWPLLQALYLESCPNFAGGVVSSGWFNIQYLDYYGSGIVNQGIIDMMIHNYLLCVQGGAPVGGELHLEAGTNAAPSVLGLADVVTLAGLGCLVYHN